jgi:hypothetical protein
LQNVCPEIALRPRYQEGFLVGKFPVHATKEADDNLAQRLVAKFYLDNNEGNFWDKDFRKMPKNVLFPGEDKLEIELIELKGRFINKSE